MKKVTFWSSAKQMIKEELHARLWLYSVAICIINIFLHDALLTGLALILLIISIGLYMENQHTDYIKLMDEKFDIELRYALLSGVVEVLMDKGVVNMEKLNTMNIRKAIKDTEKNETNIFNEILDKSKLPKYLKIKHAMKSL